MGILWFQKCWIFVLCVCVMEGKCTEIQDCKSNTRLLKRKMGMSNLHLHRRKHNWMVGVVVVMMNYNVSVFETEFYC
jgi:hypothetical protein